MAATTLGETAGDAVTMSMGLGYVVGTTIVFGKALADIAAAYVWTNLSRTALFWAAFILSRPLGATVGDFHDKPLAKNGLALSRYSASACIVFVRQRPERIAVK